MDLEITRVESGEHMVLVCAGRLDAETVDELGRVVAEELRRGHHAIRLDLDAATFLSSAGIRGLFETQRSTKVAGGTCFIRRMSPVVRKVLDLTRLTPLFVEPDAGPAPLTGTQSAAVDRTCGPVRLLGVQDATGAALHGGVVGSPADTLCGRGGAGTALRLAMGGCCLGLGAIADGQSVAARAGEMAAVAGAVFHRPPRQHAAVDFVIPTGDLTAEVGMLTGVVWDGLPTGRAGFEPAGDEAAVRLDDLLEAVLGQTDAGTIAVVVAGEVHGLVGAELIRPLAEAREGDSPLTGTRDVAATWISFSREPVYARHTAVVIGVVTRDPAAGLLAPHVRPVPGRAFASHCHAVVFPYRPLRRGGLDLAATVADLAASSPLAVLHLVADPMPVLGSGRSELVRGGVWFAPLEIRGGGTRA